MKRPHANGIVTLPAGACLASSLCGELKQVASQDLSQVAVIVPTRRLGVHLSAMLARDLGALLGPFTYTLDEFLLLEAACCGFQPAVASELHLRLLTGSLIELAGYEQLKPGGEREVLRFFDEIQDQGDPTAIFSAIRVALAEEVYRNDEFIGSLTQRVAELEDLFGRLSAELKSRGLWPGRRAVGECVRVLEEIWRQDERVPRWQAVYLAGFTSAAPVYHDLLSLLPVKKNVAVWMSASPDEKAPAPSLVALRQALTSAGGRDVGPAPAPCASGAVVSVHEAPSVFDEINAALGLVAEWMVGGLDASEIALVVTDEQTYTKLLRTRLAQQPYGTNIALSQPMSQSVLGSWLRLLGELMTEGEPIDKLVSFLAHPITAGALARRAPAGSALAPGPFRELLTRETASLSGHRGLSALAKRVRDEVLRAAVDDASELLAPLKASSRGRSLGEWSAVFGGLFEVFALPDARLEKTSGIGASSLAGTEEFLGALAESAAGMGETPLSAQTFWRFVFDDLLSRDTRGVGEPFSGLQVLSVPEARYVPFAAAIILGCTEGRLPQALAGDRLIDDFLRRRAKLPERRQFEAMEDLTFGLLRARLPRLALFYPAAVFGKETMRSRFVEQRIAGGQATFRREPNLAESLRLGETREAAAEPGAAASPTRLERRQDPAGHYPGERSWLRGDMSATALERLIRCPYSFLLARLGVVDRPLATAKPDARMEGEWLHAVLEAFFTGGTKEQPGLAPPWPEELSAAAFEPFARARLAALTERIFPTDMHRGSLHTQLLHVAWPKFARHLSGLLAGGVSLSSLSAGLREVAIGPRGGAAAVCAVDVGGERISIEGRLDSLDVFSDLHVITDYKRRSPPSAREVQLGITPQLVLYALALDRSERPLGLSGALPLERCLVGYWDILAGRFETRAVGAEASAAAARLGLPGSKNQLETTAASLLELWHWRNRAVFDDRQPFTPDETHCAYCRLDGICRKAEKADGHPKALLARLAGVGVGVGAEDNEP